MKLRARSSLMKGQTVHAMALPTEPGALPSLFVQDAEDRGLGAISVAAALRDYEVIDATPAERAFLASAGFPFGGIQ
jgi:hypothetical protein